jgi:hypothetical protein
LARLAPNDAEPYYQLSLVYALAHDIDRAWAAAWLRS